MRKDSPALWLGAAIVAYCALWVLAPRAVFFPIVTAAMSAALPLTHGYPAAILVLAATALVFAPTIAFMAVQFAVVYYFARLKMDFRRSAAVFVGCVLAAAVLMALMVVQSGVAERLHRLPTFRESLWVAAYYQGSLKMAAVVMVMLAAASLGCMVSLRVTDKNLLVPVVMFAAYIDLWTVTRGPVSVMMKRAPELVHAVAAPIPQVGAGAFIPKFLVGPGDFLFAGLVFAVVSRLGMNGPRNYWFVFGAMTLGMLAIAAGVLDSFPALILLAIGVVAANRREFKFSRHEAISVAVVGAVLAATLPLVWSILGPKAK